MKKVVYVLLGVLLVMAMLLGGCQPAPETPAPVQTVIGTLGGITPSSVTVNTPGGAQVLPITANTEFTLNGVTCPIEEIQKIEAATNSSYNCTVVLDPNGGGNVIDVYVSTGPRVITGAVTSINASSVTVSTPGGPQVVQLNPNTDFIVNGEACPLSDIQTIVDLTKSSVNCSVVFDYGGAAQSVFVTTGPK